MPGRQEQARQGVDQRGGVTLAIYHTSRDVEPHLANLRRSPQFRLTCVPQRSAHRCPAGSVDGVLWELKSGMQPDRRRLRSVARGVVAASYSVDDDRTLTELSRAIGFASHLRAPLREGDVSRVFAARSQEMRVLNPIDAHIGEQVILGLEEGTLLRSSLAVYMVPLVTLIAGGLFGQWMAPALGLQESADLLATRGPGRAYSTRPCLIA